MNKEAIKKQLEERRNYLSRRKEEVINIADRYEHKGDYENESTYRVDAMRLSARISELDIILSLLNK